GYARYWNHDYRGAADAFATLVKSFPGAALADDARYGQAIALWRAGDRELALSTLKMLTGGSPGKDAEADDAAAPHFSQALLSLTRGTVLRMGLQRYPLWKGGLPERLLVVMFDLDGAAMARAVLPKWERRMEAAARIAGPHVRHVFRERPTSDEEKPPEPVHRPPTPVARPLETSRGWTLRLLIALGAILLLALLAARAAWRAAERRRAGRTADHVDPPRSPQTRRP